MSEMNQNHKRESDKDSADLRERRSRQKRIGNQLRRLYEDVATESIPDDFLRLLEEADKKKNS